MVKPVPTLLPLTFHWYTGVVPPLVGVAENPTLVPAQTALEGLLAMLTETGNVALTTWVMLFEVAGDPLAQPAFELSWQVITSLLTGTKLKLFKLLPTLIPLTFHW